MGSVPVSTKVQSTSMEPLDRRNYHRAFVLPVQNVKVFTLSNDFEIYVLML